MKHLFSTFHVSTALASLGGFAASADGMGAAVFGGIPSLPSFFASIDLTEQQLGMVLIVILLGIPAVVGLKTIFGQAPARRIDGQPLRVKQEPEYVEKAGLQRYTDELTRRIVALEENHLELQRRIDSKFTELDSKRSRDVSNLHKHIESETKDLHGRITDSCQAIDDKISGMPQRLFDLLTAAKKLS